MGWDNPAAKPGIEVTDTYGHEKADDENGEFIGVWEVTSDRQASRGMMSKQ